MSDSYLSLVPIQNQLSIDVKKNQVKNQIMVRINEIGLNNDKYKNSQELLLLICNLAEHLITKKDKISKKEMVLDILQILFQLNAQDKISYDSNIEFLHQSKMIKKVSFWKLFKAGLCEFLFKKK